MLFVDIGIVGRGLAHDDVDLATRVAGAGGPPFLCVGLLAAAGSERTPENGEAYGAVQDVVVSGLGHGKCNVCGIAGGDIRLGHQKGRSNLSTEERLKPLFLLSIVSVLGENFHVAGVWCRTIACLDTLRQSLPGIVQVPESRTSEAVLDRPIYSAIKPYSTFENPAPCVK